MRLRILRSVVLPAPLRPMMPTTSPRLTSNETSFKAQKSSIDGGAPKRVRRLLKTRPKSVRYHIAQCGVTLRPLVANTVFLTDAFSTRITTSDMLSSRPGV